MKYLAITLPGGTTINAPSGIPTGGTGTLSEIIGNAVGIAFVIAVLMVFIFIVWAGIQWLTSGGDKEKIAAARKRIIYSIIGLTIVFLSVFFVNIILTFFGATLL